MLRRLALALLLVVPGVVVVWAGLRDTGVRTLKAVGTPWAYLDTSDMEPGRRYVLRPGDLLGRICERLPLGVGEPALLGVFFEEE